MMLIHASADSANVIFQGNIVGFVYWSMSEQSLVNVRVEPVALPLVREWAVAMGGEFQPDTADPNATSQ
jgi:hypothetical protein